MLFSSPPSIHVVNSHDTDPQESTQLRFGDVDRDEADDLDDYMVSFPGVRHVTSMGTLSRTFNGP